MVPVTRLLANVSAVAAILVPNASLSRAQTTVMVKGSAISRLGNANVPLDLLASRVPQSVVQKIVMATGFVLVAARVQNVSALIHTLARSAS
jgi:hypothetical protein